MLSLSLTLQSGAQKEFPGFFAFTTYLALANIIHEPDQKLSFHVAIPGGHFKIFHAQRMFALAVTEIVRIADLELRAHVTRISKF